MNEKPKLTAEEYKARADKIAQICGADMQASVLIGTVREVYHNASNKMTSATIEWKVYNGKSNFKREYIKIWFRNIGGYWGHGENSRLLDLKPNAVVKIEYRQETQKADAENQKPYQMQLADSMIIIKSADQFWEKKKDEKIIAAIERKKENKRKLYEFE